MSLLTAKRILEVGLKNGQNGALSRNISKVETRGNITHVGLGGFKKGLNFRVGRLRKTSVS